MATPRRLKVMFAFPSYGGNGGISSEVPDVRKWMCRILPGVKEDERIVDPIAEITLGDTPITMVRNRFVVEARKVGADVLVMCDSDMNPLKHAHEKDWKEFFQSSFDFLYSHYDKGPCVIGAPYCGPPGDVGENVYVFRWMSFGDKETTPVFRLEQMTRAEAAKSRGIQPVAALPTGLIMYDMRAFELTEPKGLTRRQIVDKIYEHEVTRDEAMTLLRQGWFYYEWTDASASQKGSTEDVTNTRDISLAGMVKLGYNPMYCNWDSPVGHWKPWCVSGRPRIYEVDDVAECFLEAAKSPYRVGEKIVEAHNPLESKGG